MVLDKLGSSLKSTLSKITGASFVDEKLINELVKDIQRALLQSDVNVKLVFNLTNQIKEKIKSQDTPGTLTKKEHLVKIVYDELANFLGGEGNKITIGKKPFKIMLVGLFGNGKTTTAGKVAKFYQKRGNKVALIQTDTWRPAAFTQLKTLADNLKIECYGDPKLKDPKEIYNKYKDDLEKNDIIIIDTAGRDALSDELVEEIKSINQTVEPDETLLTMAADVGQAAQKQAEMFKETCNITGVIITKLDGTAKGGGALSACAITKAPVKFIGVGEKQDALEEFDPKRFVGRLLGWGDIEGLLEKAADALTEDQAEDMKKKLLKGDFNLLDLYNQMEAMNKMGPLSKVMDMIPGFSQVNLPKDMISVQQEKLKKWKFIIQSCTKKELEEPDELTGERVDRISKGSGTNPTEVRELIKQFKQSKKMMKMFKGQGMDNPKQMQKMMSKMKGMKGMKFPGM